MTRNDLIEIISSTDRYNFHAHTEFCDGRATVARFAEQAVADGFLHYGFSPHSPLPIASPCNMLKADVPLFFDEVEKASRKFGDTIRFYRAMEIDYLGPEWGPSNPWFADLGLDYSIGSVHFIPSDEGYIDIDGSAANFSQKVDRYFHGDIRYVVESFFRQTVAMLEAGGFEIIGHFDKIGLNASCYAPGLDETPWYDTMVNDLIDLIAEKGVIAEINTKAYADRGRFFPAPGYFSRLKRLGVPVAVNSDAHYLDKLNSSRDIALDLWRKS